MYTLSESVVAINADDKWGRSALFDLVLLIVGAVCFFFSFSSVLGYMCVVPLVMGCFFMCFGTFDFLCLSFDFKLFKR
jgi:sugar phosphate permease